MLLQGEDPAAFRAFEQDLRRELAPEGHLQALLAARVAIAAWRLMRADRMESEILGEGAAGADPSSPAALGRALIRDGYGPRAFETLLRYRGTTLAEFWRSLTALKALQAEAAERTAGLRPNPALRPPQTERTRKDMLDQ